MKILRWKRKISTVFAVLVCCAFALFGIACAKEETKAFEWKEKSVVLEIGESRALEILGAKTEDVSFASSNPLIAKIDETGRVFAVSVGDCSVQAEHNGKYAVCKVTVKENSQSGNTAYPVLTVSQNEAELLLGKGLSVSATFALDGEILDGVNYAWRSFNEEIVSVNADGGVAALNGLRCGEAEVVVRVEYGGTLFEQTVLVCVKADAFIELDRQEAVVYLAELAEGQKRTATFNIVTATVGDEAYEGDYICEVVQGDSVKSFSFEGKTLTVTGDKEGATVLRVGYYVPDTEVFVSADVSVAVRKSEGVITKAFRFDIEKNAENKCVLAESFEALALNGEFVGLFFENGKQLNAEGEIAFLYSEVSTLLNSENVLNFVIETSVAKYAAKAKLTDRTGWIKISSFEDLDKLRTYATKENGYTINGKFYLTRDIDCTGKVLKYIEANLGGTLDGNGYAIKNLSMQTANGWSSTGAYFLASVYAGGTLKNISFNGFQAERADGSSIMKYGYFLQANFGTLENVVVRCAGNMMIGFKGLTAKNRGKLVNCVLDTSEWNVYKGIAGEKNSISAFITSDNGASATIENCYVYSLAVIDRFNDASNGFTIYGLLNGTAAVNSAWYTQSASSYDTFVATSREAFGAELKIKVEAGTLSQTAYELYLSSIKSV